MKKIISFLLAMALTLALALSLASCGADEPVGTGVSGHYGVRSTEGRTLRFAKIVVKGYGSVVLLLEESTAPITVNNFLDLANSGFYDGLTFHRVMSNFMIQGGDPDANGTGGSDTDIKGEFLLNGHYNDLSHLYGTISMARANDPDSASSQFFICNADASSSLDYRYASFGYVVAGMSVIEAITAKTEVYADTQMSNVIPKKRHQAKIRTIKEISRAEAIELVLNLAKLLGEAE